MSWQTADRTPRILFAATLAPTPDPQTAAGRHRTLDRAHDLADRRGTLNRGGLATLITGPVAPHARTLA